MCNDRASAPWSQEEFRVGFDRGRPGSDKTCSVIARVNPRTGVLEVVASDFDKEPEEVFRAYLDGLIELPSETERVLMEMEAEKRGER